MIKKPLIFHRGILFELCNPLQHNLSLGWPVLLNFSFYSNYGATLEMLLFCMEMVIIQVSYGASAGVPVLKYVCRGGRVCVTYISTFFFDK
jgi:hypothetical protein